MAETLGERLKRTRKLRGLTQQDVAMRAGLSLQGVADLERGYHADPHYRTLLKIAGTLGVDPHWLFAGEEKPVREVAREAVEAEEVAEQQMANRLAESEVRQSRFLAHENKAIEKLLERPQDVLAREVYEQEKRIHALDKRVAELEAALEAERAKEVRR